MLIRSAIILVSSLLLSSLQTTSAQSVQPMVYELAPIGNESTVDLKIDNTKSSAITYELFAEKISHDEFGNETSINGDDDFLIYPPQTLIPAGKTQIVKVRYVGDPLIEESQTYRVWVSELPVDLSDGGNNSNISVSLSFSTLCNVTPEKSKASLRVSAIDKKSDDQWSVTIENSGNRYSRLSETKIEVSSTVDPSNKIVYQNETVGDFFEKNLVPPNSTVIFSAPALEGFSPESTEIKITES